MFTGSVAVTRPFVSDVSLPGTYYVLQNVLYCKYYDIAPGKRFCYWMGGLPGEIQPFHSEEGSSSQGRPFLCITFSENEVYWLSIL